MITLFEELKKGVIISPALAQFDPTNKIFTKTYWSAEGMGWVLMQPAGDKESLIKTSTYRFWILFMHKHGNEISLIHW